MADVLSERAAVLADYLSRAGRERFVWGEMDCFLFVADWVEQMTGVDPAGEYRGAYTTQRQARNIMRAGCGPILFSDALLKRAGCSATQSPLIGDAALVHVAWRVREHKTIFIPVGAICMRENMWAVKTIGAGMTYGNFPVLQAWSV